MFYFKRVPQLGRLRVGTDHLSLLCSSTVTTFAKLLLINLAKLYYTLDNYHEMFFRLLRNKMTETLTRQNSWSADTKRESMSSFIVPNAPPDEVCYHFIFYDLTTPQFRYFWRQQKNSQVGLPKKKSQKNIQ